MLVSEIVELSTGEEKKETAYILYFIIYCRVSTLPVNKPNPPIGTDVFTISDGNILKLRLNPKPLFLCTTVDNLVFTLNPTFIRRFPQKNPAAAPDLDPGAGKADRRSVVPDGGHSPRGNC